MYILLGEKTLRELEEEKNIKDRLFWRGNSIYCFKESLAPPRISPLPHLDASWIGFWLLTFVLRVLLRNFPFIIYVF